MLNVNVQCFIEPNLNYLTKQCVARLDIILQIPKIFSQKIC